MSVKYQTTMLLSSESIPGKVIVSADGSTFQVNLDNDLQIPENAMLCTLSTKNANIWFNTPNVVEGVNNLFYLTDNSIPFTYNIALPTGLYSLEDINQEINNQIINSGGSSNLISISGNSATQKVVIKYNAPNLRVDFTQPNTLRELLGFNSRLSPLSGPSSLVGQTDVGDTTAQLNTLEYYLIHSDLISNAFVLNNSSSDVIAKVTIPEGTDVGSQLDYSPINPDKITANDLIKSPRNTLRFYLTDQNNNLIDTRGEIWSLKLIIEYELPIV